MMVTKDGRRATLASKKNADSSKTAAEASVTSLDSRRKPPSRKGIPATPAQKAALKKGTEANKARKKAKGAKGADEPPSRWRMLKRGELTVEDLTTEELQRMQTTDRHGMFTGRQPAIPAKLARDMRAELLRRGQSILDSAYPEAVALLGLVIKDPKAKAADRIKAASLIIERTAGRMPETVRVEKSATWDETFEDGVVVINNATERTG